MAEILDRRLLDVLAGGNPRIREGLERLVSDVATTSEVQTANVQATAAMDEATVIVLSPNDAFKNERVLAVGRGLAISDDTGRVVISFSEGAVMATGGFDVRFIATGDSAVTVPLAGILATTSNAETLSSKTLSAPKLSDLGNHADDTAAAGGGIPIGGVYRDGSALKVRVA